MPLANKGEYTFVGWYKASDFDGEAVTELTKEEAYDEDGSITLYAKWNKVENSSSKSDNKKSSSTTTSTTTNTTTTSGYRLVSTSADNK